MHYVDNFLLLEISTEERTRNLIIYHITRIKNENIVEIVCDPFNLSFLCVYICLLFGPWYKLLFEYSDSTETNI